MPTRENSFVPLRHTFWGEYRYLTPLQVFRNGDRSDSTINDFQKLLDKIIAALKLLTFREQHVIVQFWSPRVVGKHRLLTTKDQPFGVGVLNDDLCTYRRESERKFFLVDKDCEEEDHSPAARIFKHELPEWSFDLNSYTAKQFPQQACAIRCGFQGYLGLPVFDSETCVGVIEILMSSKYTSYAYEVQQLYNALKTVDLRTHQAFDCHALNVPNEHMQNAFDKIYAILKMVCDIHQLPLAQTWGVSQHASFVSHEKVLENSCSSFDTRCVGKVCMSRSGLPFHVQDMRKWPFFKASRERHLDKSRGLVGNALLARGSCFCEDVTRLSEEEYPLVHYARMNGLTGCFAIFLHSVEAGDDYVLEFILPTDIKETKHVLNLVQTLNQNFQLNSGFELGDSSRIHVVEPPTEDSIPLDIDPDTIQIFSTATTNNNQLEMVTSDSELMVVNTAKTDSQSISNQWPPKHVYRDTLSNIGDDITRLKSNVICVGENESMLSCPNLSMQKKSNNVTHAGKKCNSSREVGKRKIDSLVMEEVEKHVWKTINQAAKSLNESSLLHAFPKKTVASISNTKMVTVKATFNDDMIKFQFPISSGLMELKNEVAQRIKLETRRIRLQYKDEDNDMILLLSDEDLKFLLDPTANNGTIRLIIVDDYF